MDFENCLKEVCSSTSPYPPPPPPPPPHSVAKEVRRKTTENPISQTQIFVELVLYSFLKTYLGLKCICFPYVKEPTGIMEKKLLKLVYSCLVGSSYFTGICKDLFTDFLLATAREAS